jgi:hypothetical protein
VYFLAITFRNSSPFPWRCHSVSDNPPAGHQPYDDYYHGYDYQKVNQSAADVKRKRAQQPSNEEYDCDQPDQIHTSPTFLSSQERSTAFGETRGTFRVYPDQSAGSSARAYH